MLRITFAFAVLAAASPLDRAIAGGCYADWSVAAPIVRKEGLATVETLARRAQARISGDIVKTTLCEEKGGFVYRLADPRSQGAALQHDGRRARALRALIFRRPPSLPMIPVARVPDRAGAPVQREWRIAMRYVEGFVVPVPKKKLPAYRRLAQKVRQDLARVRGALEVCECVADDVEVGKLTSFPRSVKLKPGETVVFSWIAFKSRADRDRINAKVIADPRTGQDDEGPQGLAVRRQAHDPWRLQGARHRLAGSRRRLWGESRVC